MLLKVKALYKLSRYYSIGSITIPIENYRNIIYPRTLINKISNYNKTVQYHQSIRYFSTEDDVSDKLKAPSIPKTGCGPIDEDEEDMEEMFIEGPAGLEWGGPTRGGRRPEPTRYGDWERKGRATDF
mmetsp:Transcript_6882/g.6184  ORF Transcript_6882/g.6184 Transcript_6882/m.6184 type:complete len:127 (+) Transcript_6882:33-413(+)